MYRRFPQLAVPAALGGRTKRSVTRQEEQLLSAAPPWPARAPPSCPIFPSVSVLVPIRMERMDSLPRPVLWMGVETRAARNPQAKAIPCASVGTVGTATGIGPSRARPPCGERKLSGFSTPGQPATQLALTCRASQVGICGTQAVLLAKAVVGNRLPT